MLPPMRPRPIIASCMTKAPWWWSGPPRSLTLAAPSLLIRQVELVVADQHHIGHAEEQPRADDAGDRADRRLQLGGPRDRAGAAVEDGVAVVALEQPAVLLERHRDQAEAAQAPLAQR